MLSTAYFDLCKKIIVYILKTEVDFDLSESQSKFHTQEKIRELLERKKSLDEAYFSFSVKQYEDPVFTFLPNSNKDEFFYFVHSGVGRAKKMIFRIYGYSKNIYYDWLNPEFKSSKIRKCAEAQVETLYDRESFFLSSEETLKSLNKIPEFGKLFKVDTHSPQSLIATNEGLKKIANLRVLNVSFQNLLASDFIGYSEEIQYSEFMEKCQNGTTFFNKYNHKITVLYDEYTGKFEKILAHGNKYSVHLINIKEKNLNIFTNSFSISGFKPSNKEHNVLKDGLQSRLRYHPDKNEYVAEHYPSDYTEDELKGNELLGTKGIQTIFNFEKLDEFTTYSLKTHIELNGDLILKADYKSVVSSNHIEDIKKRETKNHVFVSLDMFGFNVLCALYEEPAYRMDGVSISVGKGRLLFYETLKVMRENGFVWVILYPGCQIGWKSVLIKIYEKWGVKNSIIGRSGTFMYDKIENILKYENK
jgi:hypothetical protein